MVAERKREVVNNILESYSHLIDSNDNPHEQITMFDVVSYYTNNYNNKEFIGGKWVRGNCPEPLMSLPS